MREHIHQYIYDKGLIPKIYKAGKLNTKKKQSK